MGIKETASIEFLQSAFAAEQKRREEAEEEIVRSRYATRRAAEEGVALQARVQELETDLEGQRLRADLAATMMAEDREAGKRWLDALRDDNARLLEELKKKNDHEFYSGFALAAATVCDLGGHLNAHEVFTENGVTWEQMKAAGVDKYDLDRIKSGLGSDLRRIRSSRTKPRAALAKPEGGAS